MEKSSLGPLQEGGRCKLQSRVGGPHRVYQRLVDDHPDVGPDLENPVSKALMRGNDRNAVSLNQRKSDAANRTLEALVQQAASAYLGRLQSIDSGVSEWVVSGCMLLDSALIHDRSTRQGKQLVTTTAEILSVPIVA